MAGPAPTEPFPHAAVHAAIVALGHAQQDLHDAEILTWDALLGAQEDWTGATRNTYEQWEQQRQELRTDVTSRIADAIETLQAAAKAAS